MLGLTAYSCVLKSGFSLIPFLLNNLSYNCFFLALRIHISEVTKRILEALGGFNVENRGEVYLKVSLTKNGYNIYLVQTHQSII